MKLRYTRDERLRKTTAEAVLSDPAATPADRMGAVRSLERLELAAQRRAGRPKPVPPSPPAEPTVDDLVSQLEAQKQPLQPIETKGPENASTALNVVLAPPSDEKALEVTQEPQGPPVASCAFCFATGPWNTRFPVGQADGILLCPSCFSKMCASDMRQTAAAARARAERPTDWAEDFATQRNVCSSDFEKSRALWAEQDREAADQADIDRAERARAEAQYNAARARWIQDGGRL